MAIAQKKPVSTISQAKRISVSFEGEQECFILSLLCFDGFTFTITVPRKKSDTCQFLSIVDFTYNNKTYTLEPLINALVMADGKQIDPAEKNYTKYSKRNTIAATNNLLVGLAQLLGWKIHFKTSKVSEITLKMNRINVLSRGASTFTCEDVARFGYTLNQSLKDAMKHFKRDTPLAVCLANLPVHQLVELEPWVVDPSGVELALCPQQEGQHKQIEEEYEGLPPSPCSCETTPATQADANAYHADGYISIINGSIISSKASPLPSDDFCFASSDSYPNPFECYESTGFIQSPQESLR